jgi:hypothetical protein
MQSIAHSVVLLGAFVMFAFYGAGLGVVQSLQLTRNNTAEFDVAGFPSGSFCDWFMFHLAC